jgi:hypothetical protein
MSISSSTTSLSFWKQLLSVGYLVLCLSGSGIGWANLLSNMAHFCEQENGRSIENDELVSKMFNSSKKSEENACNAFIEILQKIKSVEYKIVCRPEEKNRNAPDIDFILAPNVENDQYPEIAVEHTIIEAHDKQIAYVNQLYDVVEKINQKCQGKLPTDRYFSLSIPPALVRGTKVEIDQLIEEMSRWVLDIAETSTIDQFNHFDKWIPRLYKGHKASLTCGDSFSEWNGSIGMMPMRPENDENDRQHRFRTAIEKKLPKLITYKEKGFTTALLLEDISFSHSNPGDKLKVLIPNRYHSEFESKIDYVVIFVSNRKKMIVGLVWKEGSQLYSEIPENRRFSGFSFQQ